MIIKAYQLSATTTTKFTKHFSRIVSIVYKHINSHWNFLGLCMYRPQKIGHFCWFLLNKKWVLQSIELPDTQLNKNLRFRLDIWGLFCNPMELIKMPIWRSIQKILLLLQLNPNILGEALRPQKFFGSFSLNQ